MKPQGAPQANQVAAPSRLGVQGRGLSVVAHGMLHAIALALLAACANPPGASAPSTAAAASIGPSARLLLRGTVSPDDRFALNLLTDTLQCKEPQLLSSGTAQRTPEPAMLPADVLTTLEFQVLRAGQPSCALRWSFSPKAGRTYLVQGLAGAVCSARLLDVSSPERPQIPPDAVLRSLPGQACVPMAQARAAAPQASLIQGGQYKGEAVLNPNASTRDLQGLIPR